MFKKSFFKEIGKNTGKWASNKVFGDDWGTPFRFSNSDTKLAKKAIEYEKEIRESAGETQVEMKRMAHQFRQTKSYESKKNEIISMYIPDDKKELFSFSNFLLSNIYGAGWGFSEEERYLNAFSNACLKKLEQCRVKFKMMGAAFEIEYLNKEISTLKRKRFFERYGLWLVVLAVMAFCVVVLKLTETI